MMRARTIAATWRPVPIAFALGLGIAALGAGLAHSETVSRSATTTAAQAAISPPVATKNDVTPGFICHAQAGGWCDLRDWRGFGEPVTNLDLDLN